VLLESVFVFRQVDKLNDGRNWRKGLRVRAVLRRPVTEASPHQLSPDLWTDHWPLKSLQDKPATRLKRPDLDHLAASDEERSPDSPTPAAARSPDHSVSPTRRAPARYHRPTIFFMKHHRPTMHAGMPLN